LASFEAAGEPGEQPSRRVGRPSRALFAGSSATSMKIFPKLLGHFFEFLFFNFGEFSRRERDVPGMPRAPRPFPKFSPGGRFGPRAAFGTFSISAAMRWLRDLPPVVRRRREDFLSTRPKIILDDARESAPDGDDQKTEDRIPA
jgi:hypothetical protein